MNPSALAIHAVVDNPLAKLELARRLLAETRSVDEVKMTVTSAKRHVAMLGRPAFLAQ